MMHFILVYNHDIGQRICPWDNKLVNNQKASFSLLGTYFNKIMTLQGGRLCFFHLFLNKSTTICLNCLRMSLNVSFFFYAVFFFSE